MPINAESRSSKERKGLDDSGSFEGGAIVRATFPSYLTESKGSVPLAGLVLRVTIDFRKIDRSGFLRWCETFYLEGGWRGREGRGWGRKQGLDRRRVERNYHQCGRRHERTVRGLRWYGWNLRVKSSRTNQLFWTKKRRTLRSNRLDSRDAMNAIRAEG